MKEGAAVSRMNFLENKYSQAMLEGPQKVLWDEVCALDPSKNFKYLEWICRQVTKQGLQREDFYKVPEAILSFQAKSAAIKSSGLSVDINSYKKLTDLTQVLRSFDTSLEKISLSKLSLSDRQKIESETKVILKSDTLSVIQPLSKDSSVFWGEGSSWCTASKSDAHNRFKHYTSDGGKLFILEDEKGDRYQLDNSKEFMDINNEPVVLEKKVELFNKVVKHPGADAELVASFYNSAPSDFSKLRKLTLSEAPFVLTKNPQLFRCVDGMTEELANMAASSLPEPVLREYEDTFPSVCRTAVGVYPHLIGKIKNQTDDLCQLAIKLSPNAYTEIRNPTEEQTLSLIKQHKGSIALVKDQKEVFQLAAVSQYPYDIKYINNPTAAVIDKALESNPSLIVEIPNVSRELAQRLFQQTPLAIVGLEQTEQECLEAVGRELKAIQYIKSPENIISALKQYPDAYDWVRNPSEEVSREFAAHHGARAVPFLGPENGLEELALAHVGELKQFTYEQLSKHSDVMRRVLGQADIDIVKEFYDAMGPSALHLVKGREIEEHALTKAAQEIIKDPSGPGVSDFLLVHGALDFSSKEFFKENPLPILDELPGEAKIRLARYIPDEVLPFEVPVTEQNLSTSAGFSSTPPPIPVEYLQEQNAALQSAPSRSSRGPTM